MNKFKNQRMRIIFSFLLVFSLLLPITYPSFSNPSVSVQKAEALGLPTWDIPDWVKKLIDGVAMVIAQKMIDNIVQSTVKWANTGFNGNPAYVTDPKQYFTNVADGAFGEFIEGSDLKFMCSPFKDVVRVSLRNQYYRPTGNNLGEGQFSCSLTGIVDNIEGFYDNFSEGGWDGWYSMTQVSSNNPYGAYLDSKIELDHRIATALNISRQEYTVNQGFASLKDCLAYNPSQAAIDDYELGTYKKGSPGQAIADGKVSYDPTKPALACIKDGPIKTAGTTIKAQLDNVLPSGINKLITAQHIEQLVSAFASGLLERFVFSDKGFFGDTSVTARRNEVLDVPNKDGEKDGIPDGYDTDGDGELDICHHGFVDETQPASNTNCVNSKDIQSSPYFIPICEGAQSTVKSLQSYYEFVTGYTFSKPYSNTWLNRTIGAKGAVDEFSNTLVRYEIIDYDPAIFAMGKYTKMLDEMITSLAKDGDLQGGSLFSRKSDAENEQRIEDGTRNMLDYLKKFSAIVSQKCDNPDTSALSQIPAPDIPTPPTNDPTVPPNPDAGWAICAVEGDFCVFSGTTTVRYGTNDQYVTKTVTDGTACTNEAFGNDPALNIVKWCVYDVANLIPPDTTNPGDGNPVTPAEPI